MLLDIQSLISLIVCLIVGVVLLICCIYCCTCKPAWANTRRRLIHRQIAGDEEAIERELEATQAQIRETTSVNEKIRNDIRIKYQLK